jgi:hypothetical protein
MDSIIEIISSHSGESRLLYARELVRKLSTDHLLILSSTTESLVGYKVRAISTRDISISLIVAGFLFWKLFAWNNREGMKYARCRIKSPDRLSDSD